MSEPNIKVGQKYPAKPTTCFSIKEVEMAAKARGDGYIDEIKKRNFSKSSDLYCLTVDDINEIRKKYRPSIRDVTVTPPVNQKPINQFPSKMQMAKNFAGSMAREARAIMKKSPPITKEELERRLAICKSCEYFSPNIPELPKRDRDAGRCTQCGCVMKFKARLKSGACPKNKW